MIRFEFDKLRSDHVYITGVTANFVHVYCSAEGAPYRPELSEPSKHLGFETRRIRIPAKVGQDFMRYNSMRVFIKPRLAALNFYGDDVIGVEIQGYNVREQRFDDAAGWRSIFERSLPEVERLTRGRPCWINGKEIFWLALNGNGDEQSFQVSTDESVRMVMAHCVPLDSLSISAAQRAFGKKHRRLSTNQGADSDLGLSWGTKTGVVLAYRPLPDQPELEVYSPLLKRRQRRQDEREAPGLDAGKTEAKAVFQINSQTDPAYPNVEFLLYAAKTIGSLYGHEATEFLNIPKAIEQLGEVNLCAIDRDSRLSTPLHHLHIMDCLAWLFGYIHRETQLLKMMQLSSMFRFIVSYGFIRKSQISGGLREGKGLDDIPLMRYTPSAKRPGRASAPNPAPAMEGDH